MTRTTTTTTTTAHNSQSEVMGGGGVELIIGGLKCSAVKEREREKTAEPGACVKIVKCQLETCVCVCVRGRVVLSKTTTMMILSHSLTPPWHPSHVQTPLSCVHCVVLEQSGEMKKKQTRGRYLSPSLSLAAAAASAFATATDMVEWRHPRGVVVERRPPTPLPLLLFA